MECKYAMSSCICSVWTAGLSDSLSEFYEPAFSIHTSNHEGLEQASSPSSKLVTMKKWLCNKPYMPQIFNNLNSILCALPFTNQANSAEIDYTYSCTYIQPSMSHMKNTAVWAGSEQEVNRKCLRYCCPLNSITHCSTHYEYTANNTGGKIRTCTCTCMFGAKLWRQTQEALVRIFVLLCIYMYKHNNYARLAFKSC